MIKNKQIELCKEFANTPLNKRKSGWDWILRFKDDIINQLTIKEDFNCECKEPEPDDSVDSLNFGGRFNRCKVCKGRVWH